MRTLKTSEAAALLNVSSNTAMALREVAALSVVAGAPERLEAQA